MIIEWLILLTVWTIGIGLIFIIPKNKRRLALIAFLFMQVMTLLFGSVVVQFDLIAYPVRLFADVNRASFSYEFFLYPVVCAVFITFFPSSKGLLGKFYYYTAVTTVLTIPEFFLEKYTHLIEYLQWSWYWTWVTLFLTLLISRKFSIWFSPHLFSEVKHLNHK